jgi:hypothetical protein
MRWPAALNGWNLGGARRRPSTLAKRTSSKRRKYTDRIRAVRKVLNQLRIRERALLDLQRSVVGAPRRRPESGVASPVK